jgi:hypothetical protein
LALLLWAVWNPIGPVPLDEYENYAGRVVTVLHKAREADQELLGSGDDLDNTVQLERGALAQRSTEELVSLLSTLREEQMGMSPTVTPIAVRRRRFSTGTSGRCGRWARTEDAG